MGSMFVRPTARIWDAKTGREIRKPLPHENIVNYVRFSPDGSRIVTARSDRGSGMSRWT
jgi:WD40 repeat protein